MEVTSNPIFGPAINVARQEGEKYSESKKQQQQQQQQQHIILFYKYHPLSDDKNATNIYRLSLEKLCQALSLKGRILVAFSQTEGLNGTLSGDYENVLAFTHALLGQNISDEGQTNNNLVDQKRQEIVKEFWDESKSFFGSIGQPVLQMNSPEDFKWSRANSSTRLFPDLNIKLVKELIGTGGVLSSIPLEETAQGYLTPQEWHAELSKLYSTTTDEQQNNAILIDCRNTKECAVGHFQGAIDPNTTTFAQFPKWVEDHKHLLENKRVFMYCTGGIRCEKASAYVRRQVPSVKKVQHLKGGIHKYLESIDDNNSHWHGRNFVFHADVETQLGCEQQKDKQNDGVKQESHNIVGKCIYCQVPYDQFDPQCVCTVCREPTLTCPDCQKRLSEFHCKQHFHLRSCYFTDLSTFNAEELRQQLAEVESIVVEIAVGKRFKQKRKTLHKQSEKIRERLLELENGANIQSTGETPHRCRNCDDPSCSGRCWGFYSLKRKEILEQKQKARQAVEAALVDSKMPPTKVQDRKRSQKQQNRDRVIKEFAALKLSRPPCCHRDPDTGIRFPPPCTRILQTKMKGKWKGKPVLEVVKEEFMELSKPGVLECVLENRLLRVNGRPVTLENAGAGLMTGDTISRIVHWHEPPVIVPERISVQKVPLPEEIMKEFGVPNDHEDACLYICNKPSSVPVHPAGPYLSNSLTMLVEAQENLPPQSLIPCHRTDRVTSGLTICCTNTNIARIVQRSMCEHHVQKLYLARVHGQFPGSGDELSSVIVPESITDLARRTFVDATYCLKVEAPIETVDPAKGIRQVTAHGKPASSLFQFLSYDPVRNVSLVACRPITGRSHQLRVHLQLLGFPIVNDVLYGGRKSAVNDSLTGMEAAVNALMQSTIPRKEEELKGLSVTDADADKARSACALCKGIAENSSTAAAKEFFTPAQLLESGHSIDLHAFQYRIEVFPKETKVDVATRALGLLELKVDNPIWAEPSQTANVRWLEETV